MITETVLLVVIFFLGFMNVWERRQYNKEKSKLIDRIMAKDYTEYSNGTSLMEVPPKTAPDVNEEVEYYERVLNVD